MTSSDVSIRPYRPTDHSAGWRLWSELAEQQRAPYGTGYDGSWCDGIEFVVFDFVSGQL